MAAPELAELYFFKRSKVLGCFNTLRLRIMKLTCLKACILTMRKYLQNLEVTKPLGKWTFCCNQTVFIGIPKRCTIGKGLGR